MKITTRKSKIEAKYEEHEIPALEMDTINRLAWLLDVCARREITLLLNPNDVRYLRTLIDKRGRELAATHSDDALFVQVPPKE
jgi:hypothetical protein